ncbi:MAG TPA: hypothetical protein VGH37_19815 [Candidatus Acidoferrum sp.]
MKNLRNFVVLFSIVLGAVAVNAQAALHGTFHLTRETRLGKTVLPAGKYTFTLNSAQGPVVIQSVDGKASAIAIAESIDDAAPGGSYLFITGSGAERMVRSVNLPQLGRSLIFNPISQRERETLSARASETVAVQIAKK